MNPSPSFPPILFSPPLNKMSWLGDRSKMYQPYYQPILVNPFTEFVLPISARTIRYYEAPKLITFSRTETNFELIIPNFDEPWDLLSEFHNKIYGKSGRVLLTSGKEIIVDFIPKKGLTKSKSFDDFKVRFFEGGSKTELIMEPGMKLAFKPFRKLKKRTVNQNYREGIEHCVFTPLINTWTSKPSKHQETMLKKVIKYSQIYGDKPVPHNEMEELGKKLKTTIKINDPIGNPYKTFNPNGDRICTLSNTRLNHVDETIDEKPTVDLPHYQAVEKAQNLKEGEVLEGSFNDPIRIHTPTLIYEVPNPMKPYLKEIQDLVPNIRFDATQYPEINDYILESRIINSGTLRFQEEYDEHYDLEKAYTQFHLTKYYKGFLGVIHQWRTFQFPPTQEFLNKHNGIYKAKIIKPSPLAKLLGFQQDQYYILPLPEWNFHKDSKTEFVIVSGIYGSTFDFRFPESSFQNVPLRNYNPDQPKTTNKPFRIFSGQLSSKVNQHDKKVFNVRSSQEFAEHLKTLYTEVEYDDFNQTARISVEYKRVYTTHHFLSFITSYTRIVMMQEMLKFDISNLSGVTLDGLYFKGKAPKDLIPQFRPKPSKMSTGSTPWYYPTLNQTTFPPYSQDFNTNTFLEGSGGTGKTHRILTDKGFNNVLYASPTHALGKDKLEEYNIKNYTTLHKLAGINASGKESRTYEEEYHHTPSVIFIDELTQIEASFITKIIKLYPHSLLLIAGDVDAEGRHYQCKYSNDIWKPTFPIVQFNEDYRAKTETFKQMKRDLRNYMKTDPSPKEIKNYVYSKFPTITKEQAIQQFKETDVWIAGTHKYIKTLPYKIYTTHSYQGKTIKDQKLYISIEDMFESTMFYTAMSRVETENQLIIVGN